MGSHAHRRAFTLDEAQALLPVLEEAFRRIDRRREELDVVRDRLQILDVLWGERVQQPGNPDHGDFLEARATVLRLLGEIEGIVGEEIVGRGLRFPVGGLEHGIVDFPTTWEGRWVFLCWRRGETEVSVWHEVDGGFAGRQPLTPDQARGMGRDGSPPALDLPWG